MENKNIIYGLKHPITKLYHYIGKSSKGMNRIKRHLFNSHNKSLSEWIRELENNNLFPIIEILEECSDEALLKIRESYWIRFYGSDNHPLFNKQDVKNSFSEKDIHSDSIGSAIKYLRKKAGLDQIQTALKAGIGLKTIRDLEQGKTTCRMDKANDVLHLFGYHLVPGRLNNSNELKL